MPAKPNIKFKANTAGGCPAASYFLLLRQNKVAKEKATPVCRPCGVPCVARLVRLPHKLARSSTRPRAQTYSSEFPDQPPLLGGAQGEKCKKPKPKKSGGQQVAHPTMIFVDSQNNLTPAHFIPMSRYAHVSSELN